MKFGHHPEPAIDFTLEVEAIENEIADRNAGLTPTMDLAERIDRAMQFKVGGDAAAVVAKADLRKYAVAFKAAATQPEQAKGGGCTYPACDCAPNGDVGCNSPNAAAQPTPTTGEKSNG